MICSAKDEVEVSFYTNRTQRLMSVCYVNYYGMVKSENNIDGLIEKRSLNGLLRGPKMQRVSNSHGLPLPLIRKSKIKYQRGRCEIQI